MEQSLVMLALLQLLNEESDKSLDKETLLSQLGITEELLKICIEQLALLNCKIKVEGETLELEDPVDLLDQNYIYRHVKGRGRVEVLPSVDSTNTYMLNNSSFLVSGDTVIAEIQTAGRGRRGGKWHSSLGKQLTLSICYEFDSLDKIEGLSVGIGVAVAKAVEKLVEQDVLVKWPNDIYKHNGKLGGILIETKMANNKVKAIIGIGLNVYKDHFAQLKREYASICENIQEGFSRNELAIEIINHVKEVCAQFALGDRNEVIESFKDRDALVGRNIQVQNEQGTFEGESVGVDKTGALLLENNGQILKIRSGHISFF